MYSYMNITLFTWDSLSSNGYLYYYLRLASKET